MTSRHRVANIPAARDAVLNVLDSLGFATQLRPISEREFVSRVLDFTRWDGVDAQKLAELQQRLLVGGDLADRRGNSIEQSSEGDAVPAGSAVELETAQFLRDMFRGHLAERIERIFRWDYGRYIYRNMVVLPSHPDKSRTPLSLFLPRDLASAIEFALSLLYDQGRSLGDDLRKCELPTCGGFFLLKRNPKGGKPAKYHDACRARLRAKSRHLKRQSKES